MRHISKSSAFVGNNANVKGAKVCKVQFVESCVRTWFSDHDHSDLGTLANRKCLGIRQKVRGYLLCTRVLGSVRNSIYFNSLMHNACVEFNNFVNEIYLGLF